MILIITHKNDFTADYVINIFNQKGIAYFRLNCEEILNEEWSFRDGNDFVFSVHGKSKFHSVWFRRTKLPQNLSLSKGEDLYILNETDSLLKNIFSTIDSNWVSDPYSVFKAENKLYQLKMAKRLGFIIPETLVTNSRDELLDFYQAQGEIVIKPLSQTRIVGKDGVQFLFTNKVTSQNMETLKHYDISPCIFQKLISKKRELRITVVGDKVFAAGVDSQISEETKVDWRRKQLPFFPMEISDDLKDMCVGLVRSLGLQFAAIDMVEKKDGTYVFLEINPNGQWVWIEQQTGLEISEALIEKLTC